MRRLKHHFQLAGHRFLTFESESKASVHVLMNLLLDSAEDVQFRSEIVVDGAGGNARLIGDHPVRGAFVAELAKALSSCIDQAATSRCRVGVWRPAEFCQLAGHPIQRNGMDHRTLMPH